MKRVVASILACFISIVVTPSSAKGLKAHYPKSAMTRGELSPFLCSRWRCAPPDWPSIPLRPFKGAQ